MFFSKVGNVLYIVIHNKRHITKDHGNTWNTWKNVSTKELFIRNKVKDSQSFKP